MSPFFLAVSDGLMLVLLVGGGGALWRWAECPQGVGADRWWWWGMGGLMGWWGLSVASWVASVG